ncbi:MAG TPA: sarcosine oxidase subunit alpha family protein [Caulobacteraceae bacterium]|jgi:sarcosine oxidase subunit alpha|nr:sarcosine oxidase subunit alpha family protein [Caulobacteraceae bacterium]
MSRLAAGGLIDRTRPLAFSFDGRRLGGFVGDTLASALVANDVRLVGRSFKYHRPRGILTAGPEEPNALVTIGAGARADPNSRATTASLYNGLEATSQNRWPTLALDVLAVNQLAAPLFVAGFYYKTFMWPAKLWERLYEPAIRRAAGLGRLSGEPDPDAYDRDHAFCDLLVIGAGAAGLMAALAAARAGLRVIVADEDARMGGRLLAERHEVDDRPGADWAGEVAAELASLGARLLARTTVFGVYDGQEYGAIERLTDHLAAPASGAPRQRFWKILARRAVLASGAIERPLVFSGNDRPGVMMAGAVSAYLNRFAAAPGRRAVVVTATDSGWTTARDLLAAGVELAAVVDARDAAPPAAADQARAAGAEVLLGARVSAVAGRSVRAVEVAASDGRTRRIACDLLAMSGGWNPAIGLGANLGARPVWSSAIQSFLIETPPPGMTPAGAAAGHFALAEALRDGARAGSAIAADLGVSAPAIQPPPCSDDPRGVAAPGPSPASKSKAFVDFQHDVTVSDIELAAREGFVSVEHLKRYTTLGMGTDQGKTSQLNGHAVLAEATGRPIAEVGTILSRPPYLPVAIAAFAGHHRGRDFRPERRTAGHDWAVEQGARFIDAGLWKRPQWFARPADGDWQATVNREVNTTRGGVGICDVSTLGKIDVLGPDAATLLDRLYINTVSTLAVGKARYGLMLREDGFAMDDGAASRLAEDRFFVTTTTANAARIMQHIDYARQVLWPDLDVQATSVTEQWATYSIAGPQSRSLLQRALPELDLSDAALPFMGVVEFRWRGERARLFRISFSGEMAFELSVPAALGDGLVRMLFDAGRAFDAAPYGAEALGVMRIEKGHPGGGELNGRTTAADLGMGRMMSRKKDFIGRVLAQRPGLIDPDRPALVGLKPVEPGARLRAGAHLVDLADRPTAESDQGYVTSAAWSPTLGHSIALALLRRGPRRHGDRVCVHDPVRGADVEAEVCAPVFVDPEGERLRG